MITVESSEIQDDLCTGIQRFIFTCSLENHLGESVDPWDEEDIQMIAREILVQARILEALTRKE